MYIVGLGNFIVSTFWHKVSVVSWIKIEEPERQMFRSVFAARSFKNIFSLGHWYWFIQYGSC